MTWSRESAKGNIGQGLKVTPFEDQSINCPPGWNFKKILWTSYEM